MDLCGTGNGEFMCLIRFAIGRCEETKDRLQARGVFLHLYRQSYCEDSGSPFKARNIGGVKMMKWKRDKDICG